MILILQIVCYLKEKVIFSVEHTIERIKRQFVIKNITFKQLCMGWWCSRYHKLCNLCNLQVICYVGLVYCLSVGTELFLAVIYKDKVRISAQECRS